MELPKIEKGIPEPDKARKGLIKSFVLSLEIGDSFVVSKSKYASYRQQAKKLSIVLRTHQITPQEWRVWRVD